MKQLQTSGPALTTFSLAGWPCGSGAGGATTAAAERLCCWTASPYICAFARVCIYVVSEYAPTRRVLATSPGSLWPACWGVAGKEGPTWQLLRLRLDWKYILLLLALRALHQDSTLFWLPGGNGTI